MLPIYVSYGGEGAVFLFIRKVEYRILLCPDLAPKNFAEETSTFPLFLHDTF